MTRATSQGLREVPTTTLRHLLQEILRGRVRPPLTTLSLPGYETLAPVLAQAFDGMDSKALEQSLRLVLAEREHDARPKLDLVWTGPVGDRRTRMTSVRLRELFDQAETSILIAGYRFDSGETVLAPLHRAMAERSVDVRIIVDVRPPKYPGLGPEVHAEAELRKFLKYNWTFGPPHPALYYDPRTAAAHGQGEGVSMHAKCVVIDERLTLIGSANFTDRGQTRNYELGVAIEDAVTARKVIAHWNSLMSHGPLVPFTS